MINPNRQDQWDQIVHVKANRAARGTDDAVSPVIGVILLVAITVVLASVVYLIGSSLSSDTVPTTPRVQFSYNNVHKTATVEGTHPPEVFWDEFTWTGCTTGPTTTNVRPGDQFSGCGGNRFSLVHTATNTEVAWYQFT